MLGVKVKWNEAKRLYERGIITKIELGQCGLDYINELNKFPTTGEAFNRACEVDAYFERMNII